MDIQALVRFAVEAVLEGWGVAVISISSEVIGSGCLSVALLLLPSAVPAMLKELRKARICGSRQYLVCHVGTPRSRSIRYSKGRIRAVNTVTTPSKLWANDADESSSR